MIKYSKDTDNIVTLVLDMKGRTSNVINHEVGKALVPVIEHLKKEKERGLLRGVILTSAKKTFLTGGDLDYLYQAEHQSPEKIFNFSETLKQVFRDLEKPGVPVVAAINGSALGSGFELALACHHRIVIDNPNIKLGHPEVTLGIMPGNGGVIRLLWLLGLEKAFHVLTSGKRYTPRAALKAGIVDELATDWEDMIQKSRKWLFKNREGRRKWDRPSEEIPGEDAGDQSVANKARYLAAGLANKDYQNYKAPQTILHTLVEASKVDFETASRIESRYFNILLNSKDARNMTKAFWYDFNALKAGLARPKGFGKFRPKKVGIIGAGNMGSAIAFTCILKGLRVVLKDISEPVAEKGKKWVEKKLDQMVEDEKISKKEKAYFLKRIKTTEQAKDFEECDLIIEAVFENKMVKNKVLREAEPYLDEFTLFASNTSSISISELAASSIHPEKIVGLHFFSPAEKIPLVEIVKGEQTSKETIARAYDFVKVIGKTPIVVKDNPGFFAGRVQNTYILEGVAMLKEGYPPALIENLGKQAGLPLGPLALADELSLELVLRYEEQAALHYGAKYIQHPAVESLKQMVEKHQRSGKRFQKGFYSYHSEGDVFLWEGLEEYFPSRKEAPFDLEGIKERLLFVQVIETLWCLHDKIIESIPEANLGSIIGWGFPAFKGGVVQYIEDFGEKAFKARCKEYQKRFGQRFKVPRVVDKIMNLE